jgi:hypothetical protein
MLWKNVHSPLPADYFGLKFVSHSGFDVEAATDSKITVPVRFHTDSKLNLKVALPLILGFP